MLLGYLLFGIVSFVIISTFIIIATILTWIVPAGTFQRVFDEATGRTLVVAGTFEFVQATPVTITQMVMSIFDGMVNAANIVFFTFFSSKIILIFPYSNTH